MKLEGVAANSVHDARDQILDYVGRNKDKRVFYFDGWSGFGAASVLRSIAHAVSSMTDNNSPPELQFGRTIYLDCSRWKSKRVMQRRIAEELKFDQMIMAMFDKQDEIDDFHGVDPVSRDVIRSFAAEIDQALRKSRYLMIFLNGSNGEIPFSRFGIPEYHDGVVIWTFNERFPKMYSSIMNPDPRYTDVQFFGTWNPWFFYRPKITDISDISLLSIGSDKIRYRLLELRFQTGFGDGTSVRSVY